MIVLFIYTTHAVEKMDGFGFEKSDVENTVKKGMKWKEEKTNKWHAQLAGIEVVFMKQGNNFVIITAYLAGRKK